MTELLLRSPARPMNRLSERRATVHCHRHEGAPSASASIYERLWARVIDISVHSVGLILSSGIEPGTPLTIEMKTKTEPGSLALLARVVHATRRTDFSWLVDCEVLTRLAGEQIRDLY